MLNWLKNNQEVKDVHLSWCNFVKKLCEEFIVKVTVYSQLYCGLRGSVPVEMNDLRMQIGWLKKCFFWIHKKSLQTSPKKFCE